MFDNWFVTVIVILQLHMAIKTSFHMYCFVDISHVKLPQKGYSTNAIWEIYLISFRQMLTNYM